MNVPEYDQEQHDLLLAAEILESLGNEPGMTTSEFYYQLLVSEIDEKLHERVFLAAIAIESMMSVGESSGSYDTSH